jgi:penicillin G amidase
MSKIKKVLVLLLCILVLLSTSFFLLKKYFTPVYQGKLQLKTLSTQGQVFFDKYGVPHIESSNRSDLYKMLGYTVAQDRYFQIQLQKMIASGRLSEWFGSKTIDTDTTLRTIGVKHYMTQWYKKNKSKLNPQLVSDLDSWLIGVNECFKTCAKPIELILLGKNPEMITAEDVLAFSGIVAFSFSKAYFTDALTTQLFKTLPQLHFEDFVGEKLSDYKKSASSKTDSIPMKSVPEIDSEGLIPQIDGSQSWVISPQRSASGFATLANDPHIAFSNPGVWYEAHIKSNHFELYGYFIPIIPFALIGHNTTKAWALTMSNSDEIDLLKTDRTELLTERTEIILVNKDKPVELKIKDTAFGPVINHLLKNNENVIMSWDFYRDDNLIIETFFDLAEATELTQFYQALRKGRAPGLNVSWADKNGNIAWRILGYFPKRSEPNWKIRDVTDADLTHLSNLDNSIDDATIPQMENPLTGYILSANQKPPFKYNESEVKGYWESNERYNALDKVFQQNEKISIEQQTKMFINNEFFGAEQRLKKMLEIIHSHPNLVEKLKQWDGQADLENRAQGFYLVWIDEIMKEILTTHLNQTQQEQFCSTSGYWKFATRIIDNPGSPWWNGQYASVLQKAFLTTEKHMNQTHGSFENWSWKKMHQVTYEHPLGKVPALQKVFNLGPYPVDGGFMVPNAFRHKLCSGNFNVTSGASTRRLVDFKNPLETLGVLPTGNSGSIFSPHYKDQVELYHTGKLRAQTLNWNKIRKFDSVLIFTP